MYIQEVMCPLFVWCKGHHKRGSRDVLVLEERILLLMTTYAPNLYRVFLTYGHDAVGKVCLHTLCEYSLCNAYINCVCMYELSFLHEYG